jgi:hypothetical protein
MLTAEACRKKAAEWLQRAQSATNPQTRSGLARVANEWAKLAEHAERHTPTLRPLGTSAGQSADVVGHQAIRPEAGAEVGELLRERLHLTDFDDRGAVVELARSGADEEPHEFAKEISRILND